MIHPLATTTSEACLLRRLETGPAPIGEVFGRYPAAVLTALVCRELIVGDGSVIRLTPEAQAKLASYRAAQGRGVRA